VGISSTFHSLFPSLDQELFNLEDGSPYFLNSASSTDLHTLENAFYAFNF